ncbi:MAG: ABC transporter ATP-binding protein [Oscillospiraceae bacterium]|nr:ABC transporter ATP-binding protein [Oscillospiraceae bacterium]
MPPGGRMSGEHAGKVNLKSLDKRTVTRLLKYLFRYKFSFLIVLVCIAINAIASVLGTTFLKSIVDDYITPLLLTPDADLSGLLQTVMQMGAVYAAAVLAALLQGILMARVAQGVLRQIRDEMFTHMQSLPIRYFDTHTYGEVMSHYTNDADTLRQMISQSVPNVLSSIITVTSVFVAMCVLSWVLTAFTVLTMIVMLYVMGKIGSNSAKYFVSQQQAIGTLNGYVEEMIQGQRVVKVFCHEEKAKEAFDRHNEELCENAGKANTYANLLGPIMNNMGHLQYVLIAVVGGAAAIFSGGSLLTLGAIVAFLRLSREFSRPVSQISMQLNAIIMSLAGASRIFKLLDEQPEPDDGTVTLVNAKEENGALTESETRTGIWAWRVPQEDGSVSYVKLNGDVRFYNVDFSYVAGKQILHDVSLYAKPGQKIAFVGATGAGKTTITNLINRFYDIEDGKIRYDDININRIRKADLRHSLGIVLQDVNLFTGTVMENIRYGKLDATEEECIAAAKLAGAHDFIKMLPEGYDTVLSGDGAGLSQGQRQLLSIARAAVADPPVMILDEATSSIDTRTEALVQKGMDHLMQGRTVFVIAHRLSTVRNSNAIMVLDHGKIIERGTHSDLLDLKGTYYQLYTGAFELE